MAPTKVSWSQVPCPAGRRYTRSCCCHFGTTAPQPKAAVVDFSQPRTPTTHNTDNTQHRQHTTHLRRRSDGLIRSGALKLLLARFVVLKKSAVCVCVCVFFKDSAWCGSCVFFAAFGFAPPLISSGSQLLLLRLLLEHLLAPLAGYSPLSSSFG